MKVHILAADRGGSRFYRIEEPARVLRTLGVDITVTEEADVEALQDPRTGMVTVSEVKHDCDVLVLQRPLRQGIYEVARQAKVQGIKVVVELDDDFDTVSPHNVAYWMVEPTMNPLHNWEWLRKTAEIADWITVSTVRLLKYANGNRGSVVPNFVPRRFIQPNTANRGVIGWTGTTKTHPHDLQEIGNGVARVLPARQQSRFHVIGDATQIDRILNVPTSRLTETRWIQGVDHYMEAIASQIGIGIVPLEPSAFNEAKSWLKGMEFAAAGVPFIASPTNEYRRLNAYGAGVIAKSPQEWYRQILRLLDGNSAYDRLVNSGYQAASELVLEDHALDYALAWGRAMDMKLVLG